MDELDARLARVSSRSEVDELLDLGCDLADAERLRDAERCFTAAADLGSPTATFNLGNTLSELGRRDKAVIAYERAIAGDETDAWLTLGNVLHDLGDLAGAMRAYRGAPGNLWSDELGDDAEAEAAYRNGIAAGDAWCHNNLGVLLDDRGDERGAEEQFRLGAAAGDALAERSLRDLLET